MSDIKAPQHSFCILPFMHLSTRTDGAMQLCCHTNSSGKMGDSMPGCNRDDEGNIVYLKNKKASDYWNTEFYKDIRKQMLNGDKPRACSVCYKEEESGYRSKREWETADWETRLGTGNVNSIIHTVNEDGSMPYNIKYIDMKLGNKCDLACVMCNPADSSLWIPDYNKIEKDPNVSEKLKTTIVWKSEEGAAYNWWKNNEMYWDGIFNELPNLSEIYLIGGEPTINPEFKTFLRKCVDTGNSKHIKLRFNTNGHSIKDKELQDLYMEFEQVLMHLSMDGIEEFHNYIRYPSRWRKMEYILWKHNELATAPNIMVDIDTTVSMLNVEHIPDFIKWKVQRHGMWNINPVSFRGLIGLHLLHHPSFLSVQVLPKETKERITQKYEDLKVWLLENKSEKASKYPKLDAVVNFMNASDKSSELPMAIEYLEKMDSIRNTDFRKSLEMDI